MPDKTILLATDLQQSVLSAVEANQAHPIAHAPYGHRPKGSSAFSLIGFAGQLPDPLTGHYHLGNGYRQYNPVLMRFNSPDSWSPFGSGWLNAYMFCAGDPINRVDPTGHFFKYLGKILGFRPNAAAKKVAAINRNIATYPNPRTGIFRGNKNSGLEPFEMTNTSAEEYKNNVYVVKLGDNGHIKFTTSRRVYATHNPNGSLNVSESYPERLTSMSAKEWASPGNRDYVKAVQEKLDKSPKGLTRKQLNRIKHPDNASVDARKAAEELRSAYKFQDWKHEQNQKNALPPIEDPDPKRVPF